MFYSVCLVFSCYFLYHISDGFYFCSRIEPVNVVFPAFFFSSFARSCLNYRKLDVVGCLPNSFRAALLSLMALFIFTNEPIFVAYFWRWMFCIAFLAIELRIFVKYFKPLMRFSSTSCSEFGILNSSQFAPLNFQRRGFLSLCSEFHRTIGKWSLPHVSANTFQEKSIQIDWSHRDKSIAE